MVMVTFTCCLQTTRILLMFVLKLRSIHTIENLFQNHRFISSCLKASFMASCVKLAVTFVTIPVTISISFFLYHRCTHVFETTLSAHTEFIRTLSNGDSYLAWTRFLRSLYNIAKSFEELHILVNSIDAESNTNTSFSSFGDMF